MASLYTLLLQGQIGYVPSESTTKFEHNCTSGYAEWIAGNSKAQPSSLGVHINCKPMMLSLIHISEPTRPY